mgnify:CR=1 FL=1
MLGNFFEYPVWLICGFLVPLALLPGWVRPISWVLAPTWGMSAIRESALGGTPCRTCSLCLGLGAALRGSRRARHRPGPVRRARARGALADVIVAARIFVVGGLHELPGAVLLADALDLRARRCLMAPIFQILLFAYIGRSADLESDEFYLIGNALQYASIPCLFAMAQMVGGERYQNTLSAILVSPAPRIPLFFGRSLPVVLNGAFVGRVLAARRCARSSGPPAGELARAARARRPDRGLLLHRPGAGQRRGEPADPGERRALERDLRLPADLHRRQRAARRPPELDQHRGAGMPFTHAIKAARELAAGASLGDVRGLLGAELLVGAIYGVAGYSLLRWFEVLQPPLRDARAVMRVRDLNWMQLEEYLERDDRVVLPLGRRSSTPTCRWRPTTSSPSVSRSRPPEPLGVPVLPGARRTA